MKEWAKHKAFNWRKRLATTAIAFVALAFGAKASGTPDTYSFSHINSHQGLSSATVKCITEDRHGFMWLGTKSGLDLWDGHRIYSLDCRDNDLRRGNNNIGALHEDAEGHLWVGTDRGVFIFNPVAETFRFFDAVAPDSAYVANWVQEISSDSRGNIWILSPTEGVFRYADGKLSHYAIPGTDDHSHRITAMFVARKDGGVFVGTYDRGLFQYNARRDRFEVMDRGAAPLKGLSLTSIRQQADGTLVIASEWGRLFHYDIASDQLTELKFSRAGGVFVRCMVVLDNNIWLGTQEGIFVLNIIDGSERHIVREVHPDPRGLSDNIIFSLYADSSEGIWAGTMFGGVNYLPQHGLKFSHYTSGEGPRSLTNNIVRGLADDGHGNLYVGSELAGYSVLHCASGEVERHPNTNSVLMAKRLDDGDLYLGMVRQGASLFPGGKGPERPRTFTDLPPVFDGLNSVFAICRDRQGRTWIGADWGLYRADSLSDHFEFIPDLGQAWVYDIIEDRNADIWIASMGDGIWRYHARVDTFQHYAFDEAFTNGLRSNSISALMEDSKGRIWASTDRGGLALYNPAADNFITFSTAEGLPDNVVYDILEDRSGFLWFGTNRGLVKFDPQTHRCVVYTTDDGLLGNQFNYHAAAQGPDGRFYFGSIDGLIAFNPDDENLTDSIPPIYFTRLMVGDKEIHPGEPGSPLEKSMMYTKRLNLPYDFRGFTISVASPAFSSLGAKNYTYRLLPGDSTWMPVNEQDISFASLNPGDYTLEVRADNGRTQATGSIKIHVATPWYASWWAYILYSLIVLGVAWYIIRLYTGHKEARMRSRQQLIASRHEKEMYENKVKFFTELAHEIRTPLALIDGPLQSLEEEGTGGDEHLKRNLRTMRQNTERLLNLTSQLLNFQKAGSREFSLNYQNVDVTSLVSETLERFADTMALKGKTLTTDIPKTPLYATIDPEALTKILSNLFNNALKYSQSSIRVSLARSEGEFSVNVTTDGAKIAPENVEKIFTPFFQVDSNADLGGVGIGLPLCRSLAQMMHGNVELADTPEAKTSNTFRVTLPLRPQGIDAPEPAVVPSPLSNLVLNDEGSPITQLKSSASILVVEDNESMREFLNAELSKNFMVETAVDGRDALGKLHTSDFDLLLTDIMMPGMDGYELCSQVKADINRSHIPVVFLTAKNDINGKVRALECGGEAYIEKPFSLKYLRQQLISILENRHNERLAFLKQPFFPIDNMKIGAADKEFMNRVIQNINDHLADEGYNVETMADVLCMSRSSLLRKIKTLFNMSPLEIIRTVKMRRAAQLINEGRYRMADICYMLGINSPSYFSKMFFKQYGLTPKEFEKQCRAKKNAEGVPNPAPEADQQ